MGEMFHIKAEEEELNNGYKVWASQTFKYLKQTDKQDKTKR